MVYTKFWDMHSGGGTKEAPYEHIFIEAPEAEAKIIFYNRFGHNPERVTCTCCGEDYSIDECADLNEGTAFHRNAAPMYFYADTGEEAADGGIGEDREVEYDRDERVWKHDGREVVFGYADRADLGHMRYGASKKDCEDRYRTLEQYLASDEVLVINDADIEPHERIGEVPRSGYVWVD